jgi:tRNA 2-thiouridine synthesizing protein E
VQTFLRPEGVLPDMDQVTFKGETYRLDLHGFLDPPDQWDENFAEGMAKVVGIRSGLSQRHWEFVNYLRHKFLEEKTVPVVVLACAENDMRLSELRSLFPTGYHRGACKISGINYRFMYDLNLWLTYETWAPLKPRYPLDSLGFLEDPKSWDDDFVELMMSQLDPPNTPNDRHLQVLKYLRDYYTVNRIIPTVFEACSANDLSLEELRGLFPGGYRRGACRMAGLPFHG